MPFLIDGYNFLFRIKGRKEKSFENKREAFIEILDQELSCLNTSTRLVFDSSDQITNYAQCVHLQNLDVLYAPKGLTADEYILELVEIDKNPKILTVVTSDTGLARQCQYVGAQTTTIEEFLLFLSKRRKKPLQEKPLYTESPKEIDRLKKIFEKKIT